MAKPIPLTIAPRDPKAELREKLDQAPVEHADAILKAYDVLQALHDEGVLDLLHGAVGARDDILNMLVKDTNTPTAIRVIRNLLFGTRVLNLSTDAAKPPGLFTLFRRLQSEDSRRGLTAALGFLEAFGRHLQSVERGEPH
jgi:uncharacterized protein YjgD (DUF1641 family)